PVSISDPVPPLFVAHPASERAARRITRLVFIAYNLTALLFCFIRSGPTGRISRLQSFSSIWNLGPLPSSSFSGDRLEDLVGGRVRWAFLARLGSASWVKPG